MFLKNKSAEGATDLFAVFLSHLRRFGLYQVLIADSIP